jgi:signal peptidase I
MGRQRPLCLLLLAAIAFGACGARLSISGDAMAPAIKDGESLTYDDYGSNQPQRGDIVVVRHAGIVRVLRVIGLPGDTVTITNGAVAVGGSVLAETYLSSGTRTESDTASYLVPPASYFLLVDNRARVGDSRAATLGFVPRAEIIGRIAR